MRTKDEILMDLNMHAARLDPQHQDLAQVAIIETEIQIDIRDTIQFQLKEIDRSIQEGLKKD